MEDQEATRWGLSPVTSCTELYDTTASNLFQSITYFPLETFLHCIVFHCYLFIWLVDFKGHFSWLDKDIL